MSLFSDGCIREEVEDNSNVHDTSGLSSPDDFVSVDSNCSSPVNDFRLF